MKVTGKMKNVHRCVIKNLHQGVITQCQYSIHAFDMPVFAGRNSSLRNLLFLSDINFVTVSFISQSLCSAVWLLFINFLERILEIFL